VILGLFASCQAAPQLLVAKPYINSGSAAGPLTAAFGDLVSTSRGLRPLSLEGFSEDLNQDGFVDPIGQAVVPAAPLVYTVPAVAPAAAAPAAAETKAAVAPANAVPLTYAALPLTYAAPAFYNTIPQVSTVVGLTSYRTALDLWQVGNIEH